MRSLLHSQTTLSSTVKCEILALAPTGMMHFVRRSAHNRPSGNSSSCGVETTDSMSTT